MLVLTLSRGRTARVINYALIEHWKRGISWLGFYCKHLSHGKMRPQWNPAFKLLLRITCNSSSPFLIILNMATYQRGTHGTHPAHAAIPVSSAGLWHAECLIDELILSYFCSVKTQELLFKDFSMWLHPRKISENNWQLHIAASVHNRKTLHWACRIRLNSFKTKKALNVLDTCPKTQAKLLSKTLFFSFYHS